LLNSKAKNKKIGGVFSKSIDFLFIASIQFVFFLVQSKFKEFILKSSLMV
jgi:hypothetical protein